MTLITGRSASEAPLNTLGGDGGVASTIQQSLGSGGLVSASAGAGATTSTGQPITPRHAYSILSTSGDQVTLRNAHGGTFSLSVSEFTRLFDQMAWQ